MTGYQVESRGLFRRGVAGFRTLTVTGARVETEVNSVGPMGDLAGNGGASNCFDSTGGGGMDGIEDAGP
ncbi:MAG: hypothetical protein GY904_02700, partial [Planctomycetaceae bacterium]|nr:hypothetical protein [Planctomycetaceae bacterium]